MRQIFNITSNNKITIVIKCFFVIDDVQKIRNHPLIPKNIPVYGYLYDVKTGALEEIKEATEIGKAV